MQTTDIHEPTFTSASRTSYVLWSWECTCGAFTVHPVRSKALSEIAHHEHRYPDVPAPSHTMIPMPGEFGGPGWRCSCGERSRPEGHPDDRRAAQTFHRHVTTSTVHWLRRYHDSHLKALPADERRQRDALLAWQAKPAATRASQAQYVLDQIL
jgi:hypothetical protein